VSHGGANPPWSVVIGATGGGGYIDAAIAAVVVFAGGSQAVVGRLW